MPLWCRPPVQTPGADLEQWQAWLTGTYIVRTLYITMSEAARATHRWEFRVAPHDNARVRQAADVSHRSLTEFVVDAAVVEADRVLVDRTRFALAEAEWARFMELLERPPRENPGLAKLFAKPSVFAE